MSAEPLCDRVIIATALSLIFGAAFAAAALYMMAKRRQN